MKFALFQGRYFWVRFVMYMIAIGVIFQCLIASIHSIGWKQVLSEAGFVEDFQAITLCVSVFLSLWLYWRIPTYRSVYSLMACLLVFALIRELDYTQLYKDIQLPNKALKHAFVLSILAGISLAHSRNMTRSISSFIQRSSFILLLMGSLIVILWAQVLGQTDTWKLLTEVHTPGKRLMEEGLEVAGYLLILAGLFEELLFNLNRRASLRKADKLGIISEKGTIRPKAPSMLQNV